MYDDPAAPSEIAERLNMSVQSVSYHLENLSEAGIIQVADTMYSEKGKEMKIYAPADNPVVLFVGTENRKHGLRDVIKRLLGATGLVFLGSVLLYIYRGFGVATGGDTSPLKDLLATPGFEFLLGGLFMLLLVTSWWRWNT
ncbi:ArsR/SmtB family transcription factor [Haloferax gibbonsii]|nr:winged helix-turn-helix domain-containing protein [Haloferax gibbonsii]